MTNARSGAGCQPPRGQFRKRRGRPVPHDQRIAGTHHFAHVEPVGSVRRVYAGSSTNSRVDTALAVADQFIGQGCRCRQRCRLRQNSDVFQQAFNLFAANDIRMTQTIGDIELILRMASSVARNVSCRPSLRPAPPVRRLVMADAESTTKRTLASESTISALRFMASKSATLVPWPNLETTTRHINLVSGNENATMAISGQNRNRCRRKCK